MAPATISDRVPVENVSRSAASGLTSAEARQRLAELGPNAIAEAKGPSLATQFVRNLVHLFALLLWAGAVLALVGGLPELAIAIVIVIVVNAVFAFVQEHRAERAIEALQPRDEVRANSASGADTVRAAQVHEPVHGADHERPAEEVPQRDGQQVVEEERVPGQR